MAAGTDRVGQRDHADELELEIMLSGREIRWVRPPSGDTQHAQALPRQHDDVRGQFLFPASVEMA
jgi:hypothetical protein